MIRIRSCRRQPDARSGVSRSSLVIGGILWACVLLAVAFMPRQKGSDNDLQTIKPNEPAVAQSEEDPTVISGEPKKSVRISFPAKELPDFEFPECMGGTVSRDSLKGRPWVASFVFTRCTTSCPMITKAMMDLQLKVADKNPNVQFVTFSVDSNFDTPEILKKYSENFSANHDRWKFLTGDEAAIHDVIINGFSLYVKPNAGEARMPGFEVAHSNRVVLVNEDSIPVATFLGTKEEDLLELQRILEGAREFPKPGPGVTSESTSGAAPDINLELTPAEGNEAKPEDVPSTPAGSDTGASSDTGADSGTGADSDGGADGAGHSERDAAEKSSDGKTPSATPKGTSSFRKVRVSELILTAVEDEGVAADGNATETRNQKLDRLMPSWTKVFPGLNASLNAVSTLLLLAGFVAIKSGRRNLHRNAMISAFLVSVLFLISYLTYHYLMGKYSGEHGRQFEGSVNATRLYFAILIPHVLLAVAVPVLAIRVFQHAFAERWVQHRKLAKIAFPIWLFVSVTGVVIYWMLYHWPWKDAIPVTV